MSNEITTYKGVAPTVFKKIEPTDYSVNPFEAHKQFTFYSGSAVSENYSQLQGIYVEGFPNISSSKPFNDAINSDGSYQFAIYNSIDQLFYKRKHEPSKTHGPTDLNRSPKFLYESASVFSIPQIKMGDRIKPASFTLTSSIAHLLSDRYSNIYNTDINTGSFPGQETFSEGFNEYFDESRFNTRYPKSIINRTGGNRLTFQTGISGSYGSKLPIGKSVNFKGSGYIETDLPGTYDRYEDYAISFFISASVTSGHSKRLVLGKVSSSIDYVYPFKIELSGSKQLHFSAAGASNYIAQITSSTAVTSSWHHVVCQKSGSNLELWLNGIKHSSGSFNLLKHQFNSPFTSSATINNNDGLKIGGYGDQIEGYSGYLDEIRIFNKTLTQAHISTLMDRSVSGGVLQTNRVGNVFNKQGLIVISSPDYRYNELITTNYTASYKSTVKLYEHSILARVDENDFNVSQNPSILTDNNMNIQSWATGSDFVPYITTIGLYNDVGQLLAIGKLGQPVKNRNDIDMNFLISIDLDKNKPVKNNSKSPPPAPQSAEMDKPFVKPTVGINTKPVPLQR
tara:strand:+ start:15369 stop:17066 length:1698 start_codon:yes stop_codon:yes gene_type:complete